MTARDTVIPGVLVVLCLVSAPFVDALREIDRGLDAVGLAMLVAVGAVTVLRRRLPMTALALVAAGTSGYLALAYPYGPVMFSLAIAVYAVARATRLLPAGPRVARRARPAVGPPADQPCGPAGHRRG